MTVGNLLKSGKKNEGKPKQDTLCHFFSHEAGDQNLLKFKIRVSNMGGK